MGRRMGFHHHVGPPLLAHDHPSLQTALAKLPSFYRKTIAGSPPDERMFFF